MESERFEPTFPRNIERSDIQSIPPEVGGTSIVLQRHGEYERSIDNANVGSLTEEGADDIYTAGKDYFIKLLEAIPEPERKNINFLVLASDTRYEGGGQRSMETAELITKALKEELGEYNLDESQLLNISGNISGEGKPRSTPKLGEPRMFDQSPEFVEFLKEKYGDKGLDFWIAFEEDKEKETRQQMGAEGPDEITDRIQRMVEVLSRYSSFYHKKHPDKRLLIWAVSHYDTISPFVKREVFKTEKDTPLGVDYGGGISISIDKQGNKSLNIAEQNYQLKVIGESVP